MQFWILVRTALSDVLDRSSTRMESIASFVVHSTVLPFTRTDYGRINNFMQREP